MLDDSLAVLRERMIPLVSPEEQPELNLTFRTLEMEARNMAEIIRYLTGKPHVALDGRLMSSPAPIIEIGGVA
jgi:hypothetical protein